jgi:imidazolonepropionase
MLCEEMIPEVAKQGLAEYIDVFCDKGFFTVQETAKILKKGLEYGMLPKIHANELDVSGGVQVGIEHNAVSVDHLERITDVEIDALVRSNTIPTVLPGASFFLGMPYGQGRRMIDAGLPIALASDYNPGSSPSGDMRFVVSLGCIKMKLTPAEALNAATINGACAMGMSSKVGSISRNKLANFYVTDALPSLAYYPYAYTTPIIKNVFLNGTEMPV